MKNATAQIRKIDDRIVKVEADCKRCGVVEPTDWEWEDFMGDTEENVGSEP